MRLAAPPGPGLLVAGVAHVGGASGAGHDGLAERQMPLGEVSPRRHRKLPGWWGCCLGADLYVRRHTAYQQTYIWRRWARVRVRRHLTHRRGPGSAAARRGHGTHRPDDLPRFRADLIPEVLALAAAHYPEHRQVGWSTPADRRRGKPPESP